MSIYRKKGSPYYHYDFQYQGHRFHGSTGSRTKREAQAVDGKVRSRAVERLHFAKRSPMTLNTACGRYWEERAKHQASASNTGYQIDNLIEGLGKDRLHSEITDSIIAEYVAQRRAFVSDSSVNRETQILRRILRRADKLWNADIGQMPEWKEHLLPEPDERVRSLTVDEEARLFAHLREDFRPLIEFSILTGMRLMNAVRLTWKQIDFDDRTITFRVKSKKPGGETRSLPITSRLRDLLLEQSGNHPIYVFTYVCRRSRGQRRKGERYPYSKNGWRRDWARALQAANIEDFRFHDLRHTAATRTLRASGNLKVVQKMLGHTDIATTVRYAHVIEDDVLEAMEAAHSHNNPEVRQVVGAKLLKYSG